MYLTFVHIHALMWCNCSVLVESRFTISSLVFQIRSRAELIISHDVGEPIIRSVASAMVTHSRSRSIRRLFPVTTHEISRGVWLVTRLAAESLLFTLRGYLDVFARLWLRQADARPDGQAVGRVTWRRIAFRDAKRTIHFQCDYFLREPFRRRFSKSRFSKEETVEIFDTIIYYIIAFA